MSRGRASLGGRSCSKRLRRVLAVFRLGGTFRPLRFAAFGVLCAALQLGLLALSTETTALGAASNALAFLISAEVNFCLNFSLTWGGDGRVASRPLWLQFLSFNALIAVAATVNQSIFVVVERFVPYLIAGAAGIGAITAVKYVVADKWIFARAERRGTPREELHRTATSPE